MQENQPEILAQPLVKAKKSWKGVSPLIRKLHLKYPELSNAEIGRRVGCSTSNVTNVLKDFLGKNSQDKLRQFQENKADVYDALQLRCLGSVTAAKLAKTPAVSLITGAAILEDKARLVRGQATGINVTALIDIAAVLRDQH